MNVCYAIYMNVFLKTYFFSCIKLRRIFVSRLRTDITYSNYNPLAKSALASLYFLLNTLLYAEQTSKADYLNTNTPAKHAQGLLGIPEDNRKIQVFDNELYMLPYFHVQVGLGILSTQKVADKNSKAITKSFIPTFMIGVGFQQQYYMLNIIVGYKLQLFYEVGVKSLSENTIAFRSGGTFFQIHAGYKYFLPNINVGYEMLSVGNDFLPAPNENALYADKGITFGYGLTILLNRYSAIDLGIRHSKTYGNTPRFIFSYEFRF